MYFSAVSHFAHNLKMALLSLLLTLRGSIFHNGHRPNLGAILSQRIIDLVYVEKKL